MISEFDQFPVFYFSNHNSITGPGDVLIQKDHLNKLDFEFEIAAVICKHGKNVKVADAQNYIAGFMIMNDWSARKIQLKEMKLNLGPAKGKDFSTSLKTTGFAIIKNHPISYNLISSVYDEWKNFFNLKLKIMKN